MRAAERRAAIERELSVTGRVEVARLSRQLSVSPISIRRDLNDLVDRGIARRVYGGAIATSSTPPPTAPVPARTPGATRRPPAPISEKGTIGLVVPSSRYYYTAVLEGIKEAAIEARARVALSVSGYDAEEERAQIKRLLDRGVTGLIVTPGDIPERDATTYERLRDLPVPVVLMERDGGDEFAMLDSVHSDHRLGARIAFQQLHADGHRAVALVVAEGTPTSGWLRAGFEAERARFASGRTLDLGIVSAPEYAPELKWGVDAALDRFEEIGITAALVHSDVAATVLASRARERGMNVSVVAYDDEVAALADPPLDAVAPRKREVGRLSLRLAVERMRDKNLDTVPRRIVVPPALILRAPEL